MPIQSELIPKSLLEQHLISSYQKLQNVCSPASRFKCVPASSLQSCAIISNFLATIYTILILECNFFFPLFTPNSGAV